jgi:hypothetical protein
LFSRQKILNKRFPKVVEARAAPGFVCWQGNPEGYRIAYTS